MLSKLKVLRTTRSWSAYSKVTLAGEVRLPSREARRAPNSVGCAALVVGPERERVAVFFGRSGIDEVEWAVLRVVVELLQDPGFDLRAAVGEGDAVEIVLDDGFGFA